MLWGHIVTSNENEDHSRIRPASGRRLTKTELIREIAEDMSIRKDIVEAILDRTRDIVIEEVMEKGQAKVLDLFTINTRHQETGKKGGLGYIPPYSYLEVKLAYNIKQVFKRKTIHPELPINRDNWKIHLKDMLSNGKVSDPRIDGDQKRPNPRYHPTPEPEGVKQALEEKPVASPPVQEKPATQPKTTGPVMKPPGTTGRRPAPKLPQLPPLPPR